MPEQSQPEVEPERTIERKVEMPEQKEKKYVAVTNIRASKDYKPGDELPTDIPGLKRLVEIGSAKVKK